MRESFLYGFVAFIGVIGAVVTAWPVARWIRWQRDKRLLLRCFLAAAGDGQLRAVFRRRKDVFGDGFSDTFTGTAGTLRFSLTRRFAPFQAIDPYYLRLGRPSCTEGDGGETYVYHLKTGDRNHPIVEAYFALRDRYPMVSTVSEAS